jgi:hypothetical protein
MAQSPTEPLRNHAREIWQAGVDAVSSDRLVREAISRTDTTLTICGQEIPLADAGR